MTQRPFSRTQILDRLRSRREQGHPIVGVAAGSGIVAKCAASAGADLLFVLSTSRSRNLGVPTTVTMGNAIDTTLGIYPEVDNLIDSTPVIGGIEGSDGSRRRIGRVVDEFRGLGFDGIGNFPTLAAAPDNLAVRDKVGVGIVLEYALVRESSSRGLFTVAFVYDPAHVEAFIEAGADLIVARVGITVGGLAGPASGELTPEAEIDLVKDIVARARAVDPDILVLAEGGSLSTPEAVANLYSATDVDGVLAESSVERIAVEEGIRSEVEAFKAGRLRAAA